MKGIRKSYGDQLMIDLYRGKEVTEKQFNATVKSVVNLLDKGKVIHYNDAHGVGEFVKSSGEKPYLATHHRHWRETQEEMDADDISRFLRDFFELGYEYDKRSTW